LNATTPDIIASAIMNRKSAIKLNIKKQIEIIPTKPFHFDSTFYKPGHFASTDTKWEPGRRWQTMLFKGKRLGLVFKDKSVKEKPKVAVEIYSQKELSDDYINSLKEEIIWRYNLGLDLSGFYRMAEKDPLLKPIVKKFYGLRPMRAGSLYEYLIIAIMLQNTVVKRSIYMMQILFESYGTQVKFDGQSFWSFWEPDKLAKADEQYLRSLKLGYRAKSVIKASRQFVDRKIQDNLLKTKTAEELEEILLSLYGIGPASVGYIMFDVFHKWGYLNHISPWEQKIYSMIFFNKDYETEIVSVEKMLAYFKKWGIWKNLAIHYVWENIWWQRRNEQIPWLEKLIRL